VDLRYSDHLAQILHRKADNPKTGPVIVRKTQLQKRRQKNITNYGKVFFLCDAVNTSCDARVRLYIVFKQHFL
jgi:hypothetical protein